MLILRLAAKSLLRHRLRTLLTLFGLALAVLAFGLLQTLVTAWYAGADAASDTRLITRNSISLTFPLPLSYVGKVHQVEGVTSVSWANWFGGIYKEPRNFFPQFSIDPESYLKLYPEYLIRDEQKNAFIRDQRGVLVGRKLADRFGWKLGDQVTLQGTIYPGNWDFIIRAIYDGAHKDTDTSQMLFHWRYINDRLKGNKLGVLVVGIDDPGLAARISANIDAVFKNSPAETLTETEKAFQLGFVEMTKSIVVAIKLVSYVVIVIILAVVANTMSMSARERTAEYATLLALGFRRPVVGQLILLESLTLALVGGAIGLLLTPFAVQATGSLLKNFIPIFEIAPQTFWLQAAVSLWVGVLAGLAPAWSAMRINIVSGLRSMG